MIKLKDLVLREVSNTQGSDALDGKSKRNASNWVLGKINRHTKGFYSDNAWRPIHTIWKEFDALRLKWHMTESHYEEEMITTSDGSRYSVPIRKIWSFEVCFVNNRDKEDRLYGRIVAAGAGSEDDPLARYDVTVTLS